MDTDDQLRRYIEQSIANALAQTLPLGMSIVVNDVSTDEDPALVFTVRITDKAPEPERDISAVLYD